MRIALDATYSLGPNLSGVGVYSREMLTRLPLAHPGPDYRLCYRPHRYLRAPQPKTLLWPGWPLRVDLFHALNQRVESKRYRRTISTFHDLFVISGDYSTPEFRARFTQQARQAAERSDLIIAVSQFTADQIAELLKFDHSRIRVVHHGVYPQPQGLTARSRTILFVGALQKRKNVLRLIQAFERTAPGWQLVLAGSAGYGAQEILEAVGRSPRGADIEAPGYVSAEKLAKLYGSASIFAFPSLDEGFGMPVLEAMANGIPVLTSNQSALAEVAGSAALLVDPRETEAIAHGLQTLMDNEPVRSELIRKGYEHSSNFSWEGAVEKTWAVYRELLD